MRQLLSRKSRQRLDDQHSQGSTRGANLHSQDGTGERVFPMRSQPENGKLVGLGPNIRNESSKPDEHKFKHTHFQTSPGSNGAQVPLSRNFSTAMDNVEQRKVSERSDYTFSTSGPPRVVLPNSYRRCEDEPIHTPGAVQTFGALIGLKYSEQGNLEVRVASENTRKVLGYGPEQLFTLSSFLEVLTHDARDEMVVRIDHALSDADSIKEETRLEMFEITLTFPYEPDIRLWCAIHLAPSPKDLVICEFEEYPDTFYIKDADAAKILPVTPVHVMGFNSSPPGDFEKSTTRAGKPLPVFTIARQKKNKQFSSLDLFNAMTQAQKQIASCLSVQNTLDVVVGIISELTGFHRVMFYRFDAQFNGLVEAELLNPQASTDVYRSLHFPASDIPKQARELYKINRIRILHDRDAATARLVCRNSTDIEHNLDLTHSYLRAVSPIHRKYLTNIGVRSTMSISIVINSRLWGLVACHGYGDIGTRVSLPIRELCRSIGECAAVNIQRLLMQQRIAARRLPIQNPTSIIANAPDALELVDANFALLSVNEKPRPIGKPEPYSEALAIMSYFQSCRFTSIRSSHNIKLDFPGLAHPPGINTIAGLLFIPLNVGEGNDFLVFFRKSQDKDIKWAGNPNEKKYTPGTEYLEPRGSFQRWSETIVGTSKEWTEDQVDAASVLGLLYARSLESWRQKVSESQIVDTEIAPLSPTNEFFNLTQTASKVMKRLQKEAERKALDLAVSIHEQLPAMVKGDSEQFKQLLVYFTNNAFKNSTSVRVNLHLLRIKQDTSVVGITIEDTGSGMTEAELDETFQEFEQAQGDGWTLPTLNNTADLTAVAQYVRKVNGQIQVTSEPGNGTMFTVELPFEHAPTPDVSKPRKFRNLFIPSPGPPPQLSPSTKPPKQKPAENTKKNDTDTRQSVRPGAPLNLYKAQGENIHPNEGQSSPVQLNVLIAEDDPISLRMLDEKLSPLGHKIDIASNGQECHSTFSANPSKFDVILMDSEMPVVDGMLSTRMIRFLEKESKQRHQSQSRDLQTVKSRIPIIALVASLDEDSRHEYIENGFDGWILKPIDFRRLDLMLNGVKNLKLKRESLYVSGEKGGWFLP